MERSDENNEAMTNPIDEIKNYKWTPQGDTNPSSSENDYIFDVYRYSIMCAFDHLDKKSKSAKGAYMCGKKVANLLRWYLLKLRAIIIHYRVKVLLKRTKL